MRLTVLSLHLEARQYPDLAFARSLILRQLTRRVGELPQRWRDAPSEPAQSAYSVNSLSLEQLENLGEALLDFQGMGDLETWWDTSEEN